MSDEAVGAVLMDAFTDAVGPAIEVPAEGDTVLVQLAALPDCEPVAAG
ncbi:hypothetical protein [Nocardia sp. NPDC020380]